MFYIYTIVGLLVLPLDHQVSGLGSHTLCKVDGDNNLAVGHNIESGSRCGQYCDLIPGCTHWTWYSHHCPNKHTCGNEADDFVLKNICYALSDCEEIVQKECGQNTCYSGQKKGQTSERLSGNNEGGGQDQTITQEISWNSRILPKEEF